jgi:phospholipase D1/2
LVDSVDDEYIIIGSANINQRSMDGARDSEIAIGAFQPHHIASNNRTPKGQIYAFRRSLWYEHLGDIGDTSHFDNPESLNCIKLVNRFAETNWDIYSKDTFEEYKYSFHHLMRYPIEVTNNGAITTLPGFECFPDTKARILGSKSDYLPPILTT